LVANPDQLDVDNDLIGDICDDLVSVKNDVPSPFVDKVKSPSLLSATFPLWS